MPRSQKLIGVALLSSSGLAFVLAAGSLIQGTKSEQGGLGIELDAEVKTFGKVISGKTVNVPFVLTNRSNRPLKVLGARKICMRLGCLDVAELPIEVPAGCERSLLVSVLTRSHGNFDGEMILYTDQVDRSTISLRIVGRVTEGSDAM